MAEDIRKHKHIHIQPGQFPEKVSIELPFSKSESNRAILLFKQVEALGELTQFSNSTDTKILLKEIASTKKELNLKDAGTSYRFITAWYAAMGQPKILNGSKRMHERPIKPLVDALIELGAEIEYLEKIDFPPVEIKNTTGLKNTGPLKIVSTKSSQFASALALISPLIDNGLDLELKGKIVSRPYFQMTLDMLKDFGMNVDFKGKKVSLRGTLKKPAKFSVDRDWSSAAYFIFLFSFLPIKEMIFPGLNEDSYQGDKILKDWLPFLGLESKFSDQGMIITKTRRVDFPKSLNLNDYPDLGLPIIVLACIRDLKVELKGLGHLEFKESNRLNALNTELNKIGFLIKKEKNTVSTFSPKEPGAIEKKPVFGSHLDHRIAMSLSLLACNGTIDIEDPMVVEKSFPNYWKEFQKMGFEISFSESSS